MTVLRLPSSFNIIIVTSETYTLQGKVVLDDIFAYSNSLLVRVGYRSCNMHLKRRSGSEHYGVGCNIRFHR